MKTEKDTRVLFVKAVKKIISEKKIKQRELADALNIAASDVSAFLNLNKNFSEARREQIAEFLGYSYIDLLIIGKGIFEGKSRKEIYEEQAAQEIDANKIINDYMEMNRFLMGQVDSIKRQLASVISTQESLLNDIQKKRDEILELHKENESLKTRINENQQKQPNNFKKTKIF